MISKPDDAVFMQKAIQLAEIAYEKGEVPVGAVLVCDGKIISKAHNQTEMLNDATAHAEMLAITSGCAHFNSKYLKNCTLYISLEPCPMCAAALYWTQIKTIFYGANDEKRGMTKFEPSLLHPSTTVHTGLCAIESELILKRFFQEKRK